MTDPAALSPEGPARRGGRLLRALPWLLWALLSARLCARVQRYAVDLPFWDDWDFHAGYFSGAGPWALFSWQHTTHRMGLGNLVPAALFWASGGDLRTELWACALTASAAGAAGLWLARGLRRPGAAAPLWDALVPLCLVTGLHADAGVGAAALAYAPLPLLLALLTALVMVRPATPLARDAALVCLDFFSLFTGYALLLAPLTRAFLLWQAARDRRDRSALAVHLAALFCTCASLALFLRGFFPSSGIACFVFPHPRPLEYAQYASLVLERPLGVSGVQGLRAPLVYGAALAVLAALLPALVRAVRSKGADSAALAVVVLATFSLTFAALAAFGRVCLGVDAAAAPRYVAYALPGLFAVVLAARAFLQGRQRRAALLALLLAFTTKEALVSLRPIPDTLRLSAGKRAWRACFLAKGDVPTCDRETGFQIHPHPDETHLQQKLEWLRTNHLSLFR